MFPPHHLTAFANGARAFLRGLFPKTGRERAGVLFFLLTGLGFFALETWGIWVLSKLSARVLGDLPGFRIEFLLGNILPSFCYGLLLLLSIAALTTAVSLLFLSDDYLALSSLPLTAASLLRRQMLSVAFYASSAPFYFTLPAALVAAALSPSPLTALLAFLFTFASLGFLACAMGSAASILLVRWIPPTKARFFAGTLSAISLSAALLLFRQARPERLFDPVAALTLLIDMATGAPPHPGADPLKWLAHGLTTGLLGHVNGLTVCLFFLGASGLIFGLTSAVLAPIHLETFRISRETGVTVPERGRDQAPARSLNRELLRVELRNLARDAGTPSQIGSLVAVIVLDIMNLRLLPSTDAAGRDLVFGLQTGLSLFLVSALALRFVFPSFSVEGRSALLLRTLPVPAARRSLLRLLVLSVPALSLGMVLTLASAIYLEVWGLRLFLSLFLAGSGGLLIPAFQLGLGAAFPRYSAPNAISAALGPGGLSAMAFSGVLALIATPIASTELLGLLSMLLRMRLDPALLLTGWVILAAGGAALALGFGMRALEKSDLSMS